MRILNVNNMLDPVIGGGTAERTIQMARALAGAGAACTMLATDVGLTPEKLRALGPMDVVIVPCIWKRFFVPRFSYRKIREIVRQADVIHLMGHWSLLNTFVYLIASRLRKPYVVCPAGSLPVYGRSTALKRIYNRLIGNRILRNARFCIAITQLEVPHLQRYGVPREKILVIPNGISLEDVPARDSHAFLKKHRLSASPIVLFVGRLNHIKGPDLLLQAFCNLKNALPEYQLVFVGPDAGMQTALNAMAMRHGVEDRVHFLGFIGGAEKFQAYFASTLLVIPSRQEAMSIVVLEAGVTGTPVLLTDQCGFSEIAEHQAGKVVGASVQELERGLLAALGDRAALERSGAALKAYIQKRFLWESLAPRYIELYRQCL
jgi:glycosyltransferase involved in cell wall biosynthesis